MITKTPRIDKSNHWIAMDYHTRKHLIRALNAARRAVRVEKQGLRDMMEARNDDKRITWQGLWQAGKVLNAMKKSAYEIERILLMADKDCAPSADKAVADEFLDMVDEYEDEAAGIAVEA